MAEVITKKGAVLPLHETSSTTFGTDADVAVTVSEQFAVAGRHFTIVPEDGSYLLKDLGSGFGTKVNDSAVTERPLVHGDRIQAGKLELVFSDPVGAGAASQATAPSAASVDATAVQKKAGLTMPAQDRAERTEATVGKKKSLSLAFGRKKKTKLVLPAVKKKPLPKPLIQREVIRIAVPSDPNNPPRTLVNRILGRKGKGSLPELRLSPVTEKLDVDKIKSKPAKEKRPAKTVRKLEPKLEPKPVLEQAAPEAIQAPAPVPVIPVVLPEAAAMTPPAIEPAAPVIEVKAEEPTCAAVKIEPVPVPEVVAPEVVKPAKPKGPSLGEIFASKRVAFVGSAKTTFALLVRATVLTARLSAGILQKLLTMVAGMKRRAAVKSIAVSAPPVSAQVAVGAAAPVPVPVPVPVQVAVEVPAPVPVPVPVPMAAALPPKSQAVAWGVKLAPRRKIEASSLVALREWWQAIGVGTAFAALAAVIVWDSQHGKIIYELLTSYSNSRQPALELNDRLEVQPAVASESRRTDFPVSENKELAGTWIAVETLYPSGRKPRSGGVYTGAALRFESWGGLKMLTVPGRQDGQPLSNVEALGLQVHFQASYEILSPGLVLLHTEDGDVLCSAQRKSDGLALALLAPETREPLVKMYCLPNEQLQ